MTKDSKLPDKGRYNPEDLATRIREGSPADLLALADELDGLDGYDLVHEDQMDERVQVYPGRRQIVVDRPADETRQTLGNFSHVEGTAAGGEGALYQIDDIDVWTSPYDHLGDLMDDLEAVVPEVPESLRSGLAEAWKRGNAFVLRTVDGDTVLEAATADLLEDVALERLEHPQEYTKRLSETSARVTNGAVADVKETLMDAGYPPRDERDLDPGAPLDIDLADGLELRDYQEEWVERFREYGSGVIDAPSGSGKTVGAIGILADIGEEALIITPRVELVKQWRRELLEKTTLSDDQIGEYHGEKRSKELRPITIATYDTAKESRHRQVFNEREWGSVVFDEAHHVPAPVWKRTANLQSRRRLGLTATPVRHEGDDEEIFKLIGRSISTDWHRLFKDGWVNRPEVEIRFVPWADDTARDRYQSAEGTRKTIAAALNPAKLSEAQDLLAENPDAKTLIFCGWREQGKEWAEALDAPYIHGDTPQNAREMAYKKFSGQLMNAEETDTLIVSRIADEGIDLPDVDMVIMGSMLGGSRRQGGQRAGRAMRPFGDSQVYLLATRGSNEEDQAREQMAFLRERGIEVIETGADLDTDAREADGRDLAERIQDQLVVSGGGGGA